MEWIFDGIGTSIVMFILGLVIGAPVGYKFGVHRAKINQKQNAGDSSTQKQVGQINNNNGQE